MMAEAFDKLLACVTVTLRTTLLEAIDRSQRADLAAQLPVKATRVAGQESAAEGVAHPGRIDDLPLRDSRNMNGMLARVQVRAVLSARNDQRIDVSQDLIQAPARFLGDQPKFIVIAEQETRALHIAGKLIPLQAQDLLARIVQIVDAQFTALRREL